MANKFLNLLGLAYRAKKVVLSDAVFESLKKGEVEYLVLALDASLKTKERFLKKIHYYKLAYCDRYKSQEISQAIGKRNIKVLGITSKGFKDAMIKEEGGIKNGETES